MKFIAFYLPQFHEINENNLWWGKGFTEWTNVKAARKFFSKHRQPKVPLNSNYYNLLDIETLKWQKDLSFKYGIDGFAFYHYWFNGRLLLEKPVELLKSSNIDLEFCFYWANHDWKKSWNGTTEILIKQEYSGHSDWINHFNYFLEFFKDSRYIKVNNKPVIIFFKVATIPDFQTMLKVWNDLAIKYGFNGIFTIQTIFSKNDVLFDNIDSFLIREPDFSLVNIKRNVYLYRKIRRFLNEYLRIPYLFQITQKTMMRNTSKIYNLDSNRKTYQTLFTSWDNTPRHGKRGFVIAKFSKENYYKLLSQKHLFSKKNNNEFIFFNAWNEWAEGMYLEPDEESKFDYLEVIKGIKNG